MVVYWCRTPYAHVGVSGHPMGWGGAGRQLRAVHAELCQTPIASCRDSTNTNTHQLEQQEDKSNDCYTTGGVDVEA